MRTFKFYIMSSKPELVRPVAVKSQAKYVADREKRYEHQNNFISKKDAQKLTQEDIIDLKREKHNLMQEKNILKAKITRYSDLARRPNPPQSARRDNRTSSRNQIIANSLQKQIESLTQVIASKRSETHQLCTSDRAVIITELQEEAKMLYMEIIRLNEAKRATDIQYKEAQHKLQQIRTLYSESVLNEQNKMIKNLERDIDAQRERNSKIRQKILQMKDQQRDKQYISISEKIAKQIEEVKQNIREERQAIKNIDEETCRLRKEHQKSIMELQSQM